MARELQQTAPDDRRRRVQRLKKMIIGIVIVGLLIPILCCVYLICRLHAINGTLRDLEQRLEELDARDRERQTLLQQLQSETAIQQGVQTQEEVTSGEVSEHTPESDPGQEMIHKVYLTFDDGPSPNTTRILDILDQYGVKATFFTICSPGEENEESLKRIVSSGNTLAIHSVSHEYSQVYASIDSFKEDVLDMQQWLYEQTGVTTWFYRFPGGSSNKVANCDISDCINFLNEQGFVYFDWNVSSGDASAKCVDKDTIVQNVLSEIGSREEYVVLMHDAGAKTTTVEALPEIIEYLQANDYMILPITANTKPVQHRHS